MVAPRMESIMEPPTPPTPPNNASLLAMLHQSARQEAFSRTRVIKAVRAMMSPPMRDARVPPNEMAPFVPRGTGRKVVTRIGGEEERMPNSLAKVSPRQQAKCLYIFLVCGKITASPRTQQQQK